MCGCLSCGLHWGPGLQPRHVPSLRIEQVRLWFAAHTQSTELYQPGLNQILMHLIHLKKTTTKLEVFLTDSHFLAQIKDWLWGGIKEKKKL